jgi:hypothetical protein
MVSPQEMQVHRKPSADLSLELDDFTEAAPPRPQFSVAARTESLAADPDILKRPRIVVPINLEVQRQMEMRARQELDTQREHRAPKTETPVRSVLPTSKKRRAIVALGLILAFSGMLLATHKYVTRRWNPLPVLRPVEPIPIGREGVTTTDVNLRPVANAANSPIGLAESGSKVKVLAADANWYEVQVVQHGRPKSDPYSSDRGWINKRYVKFD